MKVSFTGKLIMAAASAMVSASVCAADITGAGATFPYPIYAKWAESYKSVTGSKLNYQAIGSGGGIKQIKAKTVDFGASDMPLKASELQAAGLVQFSCDFRWRCSYREPAGCQGRSVEDVG